MCTAITIATNDGIELRENLFADLSIIFSTRLELQPARTQIDIMDTDGEY